METISKVPESETSDQSKPLAILTKLTITATEPTDTRHLTEEYHISGIDETNRQWRFVVTEILGQDGKVMDTQTIAAARSQPDLALTIFRISAAAEAQKYRARFIANRS